MLMLSALTRWDISQSPKAHSPVKVILYTNVSEQVIMANIKKVVEARQLKNTDENGDECLSVTS